MKYVIHKIPKNVSQFTSGSITTTLYNGLLWYSTSFAPPTIFDESNIKEGKEAVENSKKMWPGFEFKIVEYEEPKEEVVEVKKVDSDNVMEDGEPF